MSSEPQLIAITTAREPIPRRYIVTVKEGVTLASHTSSIQSSIESTPSNITHEFDLINGYAGEFHEDDLAALRANPEIEAIEEDGISRTCTTSLQFVPPPPIYSSKPIEL